MTSNSVKSSSGARSLVNTSFVPNNAFLGTVKDYFVVLVLDHSQSYLGFPSKKFYWCSSSNYIFASLPYVNTKYLKQFEEMRTYFTGEYDRVLIQVSGQPIVIDEDIVIPPKSVTELDRLTYIVYTIED